MLQEPNPGFQVGIVSFQLFAIPLQLVDVVVLSPQEQTELEIVGMHAVHSLVQHLRVCVCRLGELSPQFAESVLVAVVTDSFEIVKSGDHVVEEDSTLSALHTDLPNDLFEGQTKNQLAPVDLLLDGVTAEHVATGHSTHPLTQQLHFSPT